MRAATFTLFSNGMDWLVVHTSFYVFVILVYKLQIDSKQVSRYAICFCTFAYVERIHTYILW